jgi:hypothetical protein
MRPSSVAWTVSSEKLVSEASLGCPRRCHRSRHQHRRLLLLCFGRLLLLQHQLRHQLQHRFLLRHGLLLRLQLLLPFLVWLRLRLLLLRHASPQACSKIDSISHL